MPERGAGEDVVITGMGMVCAVGPSVGESLEAALAGTCGIRRCDDMLDATTGADMPARVAGTVPELETSGLVPDTHKDLYSRGSLYALSAAREALDDAALLHQPGDRSDVGVVCGSAGPSADLYDRTTRGIVDASSSLVMRSGHAPHLSSHAPAALIGLAFGLHGPNFAASAACGTGNLTVTIAADQIRSGRSDVMLAGATESAITESVMGSFVAARAVNPTSEPIGACRPFDVRRTGMVFGEGSAFFVLEGEQHARARGVEPMARLLGDSLTNDAFHMWAPDPESWGRAISRALERASLTPGDIACISAHAAGTPLGDAAESSALRQAFGSHLADVPVWSTKGVHGHAFAASGAMELALSIAALRRGVGLPTVGFEQPDPACDLDVVDCRGRDIDGTVLLKDSFGFMGTNAILALEVLR